MIIRKAIHSQLRCLCCSASLLQAFLVSGSASTRAAHRLVPTSLQKHQMFSRRWFAQKASLQSEIVVPVSQEVVPDDKDQNEGSSSSDVQETSIESASPLPWYLQVQTPQHIQSPISDRQRLPDLPSDPPPLLQPMLEHISIDLGLDDLSILDLRHLDPPPALGANLLMIVGTARSEKHLHVSADRYCRWLRTAHQLTPYADGLLGRGELKLKMRRKVRRARIMSRVGSSEQGAVDDGLRTGWVCVNVGTIEDGSTFSEKRPAIEGYVGFGSQSGGTKVVVQMLTAEKREELDLERLWSQALARQERRKKRILRDAQELEDANVQELGEAMSA